MQWSTTSNKLQLFTCIQVWPGAFDLHALTTLGKSSVSFQALESAASLLRIVMNTPFNWKKKMLNLTEITCWAHGLPSLVLCLSYCDLSCLKECIWVWAEYFCNSWHCKKCIGGIPWCKLFYCEMVMGGKIPYLQISCQFRGLKMAAPTGNLCCLDCAVLALFCQCCFGHRLLYSFFVFLFFYDFPSNAVFFLSSTMERAYML